MPFAVFVLGLAVFAQGTSEFMLSGLVSDIAGDLNVSIPAAGLLTSGFAVGMVVGAVANAGFWAVALVAAVGMVAPEARARATSVVVGGVTVACVAGVPAGAWLGEQWGWRSAFWAVAWVSLPGGQPEGWRGAGVEGGSEGVAA